MASLLVLGPPAIGARFPLNSRRESIIGRSGFCDIVLNKRSISREHARIFERNGEFFIADLESVNGTFLNGRAIHEVTRLRDGDRINLYDVPLQFYLYDDQPPSSGSMPVYNGVGPSVPLREEALQAGPPPVQLRSQLDNVLDIVHQLGSSLDVDVILPKVLDILFQMFPQAVNGEILLVDEDRSLSPRATKHGREADSATLTAFPCDHRLSSKSLESGTAMIDVVGDDSGDSALESRFASTMFVPIIGSARKPLGVIVIETESTEARFNNEDLELMCGVATIAGQAIGFACVHEMVVDHERTRHHLETAREIQLRMLPRECPQVGGYEFAQYYRAAQIVGGDAYCYHNLPDGRIMLAVADAVGKGLPASLKIAEFISEIRHCVTSAISIKSAMDYLNRFVCRTDDGFITFCLAVLDPGRHTISVANAGHPLPRLRRNDGTVIPVGADRVSFPFGLVEDTVFHPFTVSLGVGDEIVLFTDGVTEAFNRSSDIYGVERLHKALHAPARTAEERVQLLVADVERFRKGRKPSDDQCILVALRTDR